MLFECEIFIPRSEENDEPRRNNDCEIADHGIRVGRIEHIADTEFGILAAEAWSDFKEVIRVKSPGVLERFTDVFGRGDHCDSYKFEGWVGLDIVATRGYSAITSGSAWKNAGGRCADRNTFHATDS